MNWVRLDFYLTLADIALLVGGIESPWFRRAVRRAADCDLEIYCFLSRGTG